MDDLCYARRRMRSALVLESNDGGTTRKRTQKCMRVGNLMGRCAAEWGEQGFSAMDDLCYARRRVRSALVLESNDGGTTRKRT